MQGFSVLLQAGNLAAQKLADYQQFLLQHQTASPSSQGQCLCHCIGNCLQCAEYLQEQIEAKLQPSSPASNLGLQQEFTRMNLLLSGDCNACSCRSSPISPNLSQERSMCHIPPSLCCQQEKSLKRVQLLARGLQATAGTSQHP